MFRYASCIVVAVSAFFLLLGITNPQAVLAQGNAGITLIPATIEKGADPGATFTEVLKVTNESDVEREFYVYKRDIKGVEAGGVPVFAEEGAERTGFEISEWIQFSSDRVKVPAFSTVELPIAIVVPGDASPGSHFGGVFVSQEPPKLREIGAGVGYEVASIISIRISGDIIDTARIRAFSTDKLFYSTKDVEFLLKIENQGNIMIRPRGPLSITSMFSSKPEVITINDSLAGVFPGTVRDITHTWRSDGLGFGKYEAVVALAYDGEDGQKTIDATLVFWVFPTKVILTFVGVIVAILVLGYVFTQYYIKQAVLRAAGGRRIPPQRYRKHVGMSRFTFVFLTILSTSVFILLIVLMFAL